MEEEWPEATKVMGRIGEERREGKEEEEEDENEGESTQEEEEVVKETKGGSYLDEDDGSYLREQKDPKETNLAKAIREFFIICTDGFRLPTSLE